MIVLDSSALLALVLDEPGADHIAQVLEAEDELVISAGTLAETLIVAARRQVSEPVVRLLDELGFAVAPVSEATARQVARAYAAWGKGQHPAGLNFGDCFAYVLAREQDCPLLFVGDDFSRTDVRPA